MLGKLATSSPLHVTVVAVLGVGALSPSWLSTQATMRTREGVTGRRAASDGSWAETLLHTRGISVVGAIGKWVQ